MLACLLSLLLEPAPAPADAPAWAEATSMQEPARAAAECAGEATCQDVAERECTLPVAALVAAERPYLAPPCQHAWLAQITLAPPERPPRLRA